VKFLVDHQLPPALADFFRERGHESQHLLDIGMASSSDLEVYDYAAEHGHIIVSKDEDFLYLSHRFRSDAGLLWIRLGNCRTRVLLAALDRLLRCGRSDCRDSLIAENWEGRSGTTQIKVL
jgi:predicted nuclease of predicted toxin-antitoxin system